MSVELMYKHQQKAYELMEKSLEETGKAAYVFPTGCGKSFVALKYMEEHPDKKVLFVGPNLEIINQFKRYISTYMLNGEKDIKHGMPNFRDITYQKIGLAKGMCNLNPDIIIFDEIHRTGAETWGPAIDTLLEACPNAKVIGMSATPERTDKRNMAYERFGENVVYEMSLTEALSGEKEGEAVLKGSQYVRILSSLKSELPEYKEQIELIEDEEKRAKLLKKYEKLETIVSNAPEMPDIMESSMKKKNGKYIVFCSTREEMYEKMQQEQEIFGKVNSKIKVDYVISKDELQENEITKGKTAEQNRKTIEEFEQREESEELNLLYCVDMLNEGVHIEGLDGEIMFRPTISPIVYKQQIGRILSVSKEAKDTVIIDAVNNWLRQKDTFKEIQKAIGVGQKKDIESEEYLGLSAEETELLDILKEIGEETKYNTYHAYEELIEWLETHEGKMPRAAISQDGKILNVNQMSEEQKDEVNLYGRWKKSSERKVFKACEGIELDKIPEEYIEYKDKIEKLRSYGLGLKEKTTYEEVIEWLETHEGRMPRGTIRKEGKILNINQMAEEEKREINLYGRWKISKEREVLKACEGIESDKLPEEYIEYKEQIEKLRNYRIGLKEKPTYDKLIEWLESHEGKMPRAGIFQDGEFLNRNQLTEEQKYEVNLYCNWKTTNEKKALEACTGIELDEIPEEYIQYKEKIEKLRSYGLGLKEKLRSYRLGTKIKDKEKTIYEELIEWLETHEGKMPRTTISQDGKILNVNQLTEEQYYEVRLYANWKQSNERKALEDCKGIELGKIPEEYIQYKEKIEKLRSYGLGLKEKLRSYRLGTRIKDKEKNIYEELIEWLETHEGRMPRGATFQDGKKLTAKDMAEEEKCEINLYGRWKISKEREVLKACEGIESDKLPEEYLEYKDKIEKLRSYVVEKTIYEKLIEWLETHEGKMPRGAICQDGKQLKAKDLTNEQKYERNLYARWNKTDERKVFEACTEIELDKIPEEYLEYKDKIEKLRSYVVEKTTYEEIIEWLETHDGKLPKSDIRIDGKRLAVEKLTEKQKYETKLYHRWIDSKERKVFEDCEGIELDKIPKEYLEYKDKIETLRGYVVEKTSYEELIEWLETHEGNMPRAGIRKNGKFLNRNQLTEKQKCELNLYARWRTSNERKALEDCAGISLDKLPEEYIKYKDKIEKLRSYGLGLKTNSKKAEDKMKASVGKQVEYNETTRTVLESNAKELEETEEKNSSEHDDGDK